MKHKLSWLLIMLFILSINVQQQTIQAAPQLPMVLSGTITDNGNNVVVGLPVRVLANGSEVATTATVSGSFSYAVEILIDDPDTTTVVEGAPIGSTLTFEVDGRLATETINVSSGVTNSSFNLTLGGTPTPTPSPTPSSTPVASGDCPAGSNACAFLVDNTGVGYTMQDIVFPQTMIGGNAMILEADPRVWTVSDSRGTASGWSLMIQSAGDFSDGNGNIIPVSGFFFDVFPEDIAPQPSAGTPPTGQSGVVNATGGAMLVANPGQGTGTFNFTPIFRLAVPDSTPAGTYTTNVFVTVDNSGL